MKARYVWAALFAYLFFLMVTAPASWMALLMTRATRGTLGLAHPSGGFWRGAGGLYLTGAGGATIPIGQLSWHLRPAALLLGRAEAQIGLTGPLTLHLGIQRSWGTLALTPLSGAAAAPALTPLNPDLNLLKPTGAIALAGQGLVMTPHAIRGALHLAWRDAGTALSSVTPLGNYALDAQGAGTRLQLHLSTQGGPLSLTGDGYWEDSGAFAFQGTASAVTDDPRVRRLVRFMGQRTGPHTHAFALNAKTPSWGALL